MKYGKKPKKQTNNKIEKWTEEQFEEYLKGIYGMEFIAGFTENGVPYGIFKEDLERDMAKESEKFDDSYDEILF